MSRDHPDDDLHIATCLDCQARLGLEALDVDLKRVWAGVAAVAWSRPPSRAERLLGWLLNSPGLARALVTTPSLVVSWIVASLLVLAAGVVATNSTGEPWAALLLPPLAGIGIAYAYGPGVDPAFELAQTMAVSDRIVLLARALAVFGLNTIFGLVVSIVAPGGAGVTLGWLLPMTAIAALGLAAATLASSANVGVAATLAGWGLIVLGSAYSSRDLAAAVENGALLPAYLIGTVVCGGLALYATSGSRWANGWGLRWR